jgi:Arc/MetJ-type ribon-helix-helix transcriptional regulator
MDTLVNINGIPETVLNLLMERGYFKTKAEVIRAGILELGNKYGMDLKTPEDLEMMLVALRIKKEENKIKRKGKKIQTLEQVKKKYGLK